MFMARIFWALVAFTFGAMGVAALFSGCGQAKSFSLDPKYNPLRRIVEAPSQQGNMAITNGDTMTVRNLNDFFAQCPPGSINFEAIIAHEREHSVRQFAAGLDGWRRLYANDIAFRWEEEQIGYRKQLLYPGYAFAPAEFAHFMADNYHGMVSYPDALAWISSTVDAR